MSSGQESLTMCQALCELKAECILAVKTGVRCTRLTLPEWLSLKSCSTWIVSPRSMA